jgi:hypothetical protein
MRLLSQHGSENGGMTAERGRVPFSVTSHMRSKLDVQRDDVWGGWGDSSHSRVLRELLPYR